MNADGSGWAVVTIAPDVINFQFGYLSWSPDSQRIVFGVTKDLYIVNVDGSNLTRLTDGKTPAWSPDGQRIAFGGSDGNIYLINPDGTDTLRLTSSGQDEEPSWSPDGKQIAFSSKRDGNLEIYVMNVDGSGQMDLTNNPADDYSPNWGWYPDEAY